MSWKDLIKVSKISTRNRRGIDKLSLEGHEAFKKSLDTRLVQSTIAAWCCGNNKVNVESGALRSRRQASASHVRQRFLIALSMAPGPYSLATSTPKDLQSHCSTFSFTK